MDGTMENSGNPSFFERMRSFILGFFRSSSNPQLQRLLKNIPHRSMLLLCFLLPFFFFPFAWISIPQAKSLLVIVFVVVALLAWITAALTEGVLRIPRSALLLAALLVPVAYLISALATGVLRMSFIGGGTQQDTVIAVAIWYALFVVCVNVFAASSERLISAVRMLLMGGAFVLLIQVVRLAFPSFTFGGALPAQ